MIVMWAGQFANEGFNWILKRLYKEDRPDGMLPFCFDAVQWLICLLGSLGNGYGFPSSHSQYSKFEILKSCGPRLLNLNEVGYFSTFLICHLYFRHRFASTGSLYLDQAWRILVYIAVSAWGLLVAYSR